MELSTTQTVLVLLGCVVAIGGIFILYRRGVFGAPKVQDQAPANSAKP